MAKIYGKPIPVRIPPKDLGYLSDLAPLEDTTEQNLIRQGIKLIIKNLCKKHKIKKT